MLIERFDVSRHDFDVAMEILALSVPQPAEETKKWALEFYEEEGRQLFVGLDDDSVVGIIGIIAHQDGRNEIKHIAVHPAARFQGVGRFLVDEVGKLLGLDKVEAETGKWNANGFYKASGFEICSLGEKWPGVERFICVKTYSEGPV